MRDLPPHASSRAFLLAAVVVISVVGGGAGLATAQSPAESLGTSLPHPVSTPLDSGSDSTAQESNLTVTIQVPRQVVTNVSLNYSVRTSGAEGNVSVTWDFEGETKTGSTVQHAFGEAGNATIEVTVTDESGSEVTESVTVSVVNLADEEPQNPIDNIGTIAVFFAGLIGVPLILLIVVLPRAMEVFSDGLR
jgi:hypothetical protein